MDDKAWQKWRELCKAAETKEIFNQLFDVVLTHEEREQLALRVALIEALLKGELSQRDIAKELNVSIAKITRGSNELKRSPQSVINFIKQTLKIKN